MSMNLKRVSTAVLALCLGAGVVFAAGEPQAERQALMKKIGGSMGDLAAIAKGQKPYDAAVVKTSLSAISASAKDFPNHFPAGSETGMDTAAAPAIWQNMDDFKAKAMKLSTHADRSGLRWRGDEDAGRRLRHLPPDLSPEALSATFCGRCPASCRAAVFAVSGFSGQ
jgi:cytochrome c556